MSNTDFLQSILTISAFLVLIVLASIVIRRFVTERKIGNVGVRFKIISKLPLNSKSQLFIIQIGNRYLLIGASENNVSAIADLTKVINFENNSLMQANQVGFTPPSSQSNSLSFKEFIKETFKKSKN